MDRSTRRLPDPVAGPPSGERRRCARQKLHTPVYASFNAPQTGLVVDLSELLDLNEEGFAVQTSERLEMNRAVALCLDLPETRNFVHGFGEVVWSDDAGRGGIRFSALSEDSRQILKEWLFANLLIGCANHAARSEQLARRERESLSEINLAARVSPVVPMPDRGRMPASMDSLQRQVNEFGGDVDAVCHFVTNRAADLTGASGAALALLKGPLMIWRSASGEPVPPLGAHVDLEQGLSATCVRSGEVVSCEEMENDPRIDAEIGRALGIGSLMAVPVFRDSLVVGLLEVFSPRPRCFNGTDAMVLERLAELIPKIPRIGAAPARGALLPLESEPMSPLANVVAVTAETAPWAAASNATPPGPDELTAAQPFREIELAPAPRADVSLLPSPSSHASIGQRQSEVRLTERMPVIPGPPSAAVSRPIHLGLLAMAIVVVAIALGYLLGPILERRIPVPTSQGPLASGRSALAVGSAKKTSADLQRLADEGDAEAQWQLGVRFDEGDEVARDDVQAMKWFERAAEQGHVDAQSHLGAYYWAGRGVPEDLSKAYFWSEIAMVQGDENSKSRLEGLSSQMTREQVAAARQQAEVWIQAHNLRAKSGTD